MLKQAVLTVSYIIENVELLAHYTSYVSLCLLVFWAKQCTKNCFELEFSLNIVFLERGTDYEGAQAK